MTLPQGAVDLIESERGLFCLLALFICTVLVLVGKLPGSSWLDFTKYIVGALLTAKTVTGTIERWKNPPPTNAGTAAGEPSVAPPSA